MNANEHLDKTMKYNKTYFFKYVENILETVGEGFESNELASEHWQDTTLRK